MADTLLSSIPGISHSQQSALKKGRLFTVSDVLLFPVYDVSQRCRLAPQAVQEIVDCIARTLGRAPHPLRLVMRDGSQVITTGDASLDEMLGGGIRVGMIWEFVGEGAAGKTQLALQLSLLVQLPVSQGGLNGSACYLTTSAGLPTPRLIQLLHEHPLLAGSQCNLDNIQTSATKSVSSLLYALSEVLPASIESANSKKDAAHSARPPLKLLVIDSLADLLLEDTKTSTATLADRSRNLSAIALQLHALAATHQLAVVVVNRVTDVWERSRPVQDAHTGRCPNELIYDDHARIFGRAEDGASKSAALGLVWANQVNARIMLSRTARHRAAAAAARPLLHTAEGDHDHDHDHDRKRRRAEGGAVAVAVRADDDLVVVVVRRLSVVFSSVCAPASVDFVVTSRGVETLADDEDEDDNGPGNNAPVLPRTVRAAVSAPQQVGVVRPPLAGVAPLDVGSVVSDSQPGDVPVGEMGDDEDAYWREVDDFPFADDGTDLVQDSVPLDFPDPRI